ncbi:MAG: DUF4012 domain-containing protein [Candidatus Promineifilaceae bacterium]
MADVTDALETPEKESDNRTLGRIALLLFLTGVLLLLSWLGWKAWRVYQTSASLLERQAQFEELAAGGLQEVDPDALEILVLGTYGDIRTLRAETSFLMPVLPYLKNVPQIGPLAAAAPHLLEMADAGMEAAAYGIRAMKPVLAAAQSEEPILPLLLQTTQSAQGDLAQTALALERTAEARSQLSIIEGLPWRVETLLEKGDTWLPLGQDFTRLALALPELMGLNGPRRYLIMAQNQDELRPTGGFISGAGFLEIEDGEIKRLDFMDANVVDAWEEPGKVGGALAKPYDAPPQPLHDFMLLGLFLFRDANFWPDFAVSGQKAMDFYAYGRDVEPLDGVIGINQESLRLLLAGMGPVTVPDTGEVVNSRNIQKSLQKAWTLQDGVAQRKAFLEPFAAAILQRVNQGAGDIDPLNLVRQLNQALKQKDLQIYVRNPEAAALLAANNWDGRMVAGDYGDVLKVVDTNVGYNKANFYVDRAVSYHVQLADNGVNEGVLTINHIHKGEASDEPCWQGTLDEYVAGSPYIALTDKCYWNYLRVYVPQGSELVSGPEHVIPGQTWFGGYDWQPESGTLSELPGFTTFDSWMLLPRGEEVVSEFHYYLPESVVQQLDGSEKYTLQLMKQAGTPPHIVQVTVTPPPGRSVTAVSPEPTALKGGSYIFTLELDGDTAISMTYR